MNRIASMSGCKSITRLWRVKMLFAALLFCGVANALGNSRFIRIVENEITGSLTQPRRVEIAVGDGVIVEENRSQRGVHGALE